jgi:hypothetical protein
MEKTEVTTTTEAEAKKAEPPLSDDAWRQHIASAAKFLGSDAEYCRRFGLEPKVFRVNKKKFRATKTKERPMVPSAFVKVEQTAAVPRAESPVPKCPSAVVMSLPDARWLAEFIAALHVAKR